MCAWSNSAHQCARARDPAIKKADNRIVHWPAIRAAQGRRLKRALLKSCIARSHDQRLCHHEAMWWLKADSLTAIHCRPLVRLSTESCDIGTRSPKNVSLYGDDYVRARCARCVTVVCGHDDESAAC